MCSVGPVPALLAVVPEGRGAQVRHVGSSVLPSMCHQCGSHCTHLISIFPPGGPMPLPPRPPIRSMGGPPRPAPLKPPRSMPPRPLNPPRSPPPQPPRKPPGPPGPPAPAGPPRSIPLPPRMPIPPRPRSPPGGKGGPPPRPSGLGALHWLHSILQAKFWLPHPLRTEDTLVTATAQDQQH